MPTESVSVCIKRKEIKWGRVGGRERHMRGQGARREGGREQAEEKERLLPWKHQAEFHILNGNHGNNYRADRQAVLWKDREGERENAGEEERSSYAGEERKVQTVGRGRR